jgi:hypothetical protein
MMEYYKRKIIELAIFFFESTNRRKKLLIRCSIVISDIWGLSLSN